MTVDFIGKDNTIMEVKELVSRVAPLELQVLVTGETGTGKDLVARMIHEKSMRKTGPFIPVNCGAIPDTLLESCLFGHERGAFTGATGRSRGFFEQAHQGTLFLDEISEGSAALQTALLRVLQDECFFRIGSERQLRVNVRIIAATNRDLKLTVNLGTFREDLFFRLSVFEIKLPPLRDRGDDIFLLAYHHLRKTARKYQKNIDRLSDELTDIFRSYHWPGNVRELFHVIERGVVVENSPELTVSSLPRYMKEKGEYQIIPPRQREVVSLQYAPQAKEEDERLFSLPIADARREFERRYLERLLSKTRGNMSLSAKIAGIRRQNLYRKMQQLKLNPESYRTKGGRAET